MAGRHFVFEHPKTATSWATRIMQDVTEMEGTYTVDFDFCMAGMRSKDERGEGAAKKRTTVATNCADIAQELKKRQCCGTHRHIVLEGNRASACQIYPPEFCD